MYIELEMRGDVACSVDQTINGSNKAPNLINMLHPHLNMNVINQRIVLLRNKKRKLRKTKSTFTRHSYKLFFYNFIRFAPKAQKQINNPTA